MQGPGGLVVDRTGNVYIGDTYSNRIRKVALDGTISTFAGNGDYGYIGDGLLATDTRLWYPQGIAVDEAGNLYIADTYNYRIRKVTLDGIITTVAGGGSLGLGDNGPATAAGLNLPFGIAVDAQGNIYIADTGNNRIRKVAPDGLITTIAGTGNAGYGGDNGPAVSAELNAPRGVAVGKSGVVYVADTGNFRIRAINLDGMIVTIAGNGSTGYSGDGGLGSAAQLSTPSGIAVGTFGEVYIADADNNRIRKLTPDGLITTVAGTGVQGYGGDGGEATAAQLFSPCGVAVDSFGHLYIADYGNNRIRLVTVAPATAAMISPAPQSVLPAGSVTFTWTAGTGASATYLWIGTMLGAYNLVNYGTTAGTSYAATNLPADGSTLYVRLWSKIDGLLQYTDYTYTAPSFAKAVMVSPASPSTLAGASVTFTWIAGTNSSATYLWIGTAPGTRDLVNFGTSAATSYTANNLPTNGSTVYVRLWSKIDSLLQYTDYTYTAANFAKAAMISPSSPSTLGPDPVAFTWSSGTNVSAIYLWVGTTPGSYNLVNYGTTTGTSYTASNLPTDGSPLYARLWSKINGVLMYTDYTYTAVRGTKAVLTSPDLQAWLPFGTVTFTWTPGTNVTAYYLWIGTTQGAHDLVNYGTTTGTSYTATNLPSDGSALYVRLWSKIDGVLMYNDYAYTTSNGNKAALISPPPSSGLAPGPVNFTWTRGPGVGATYLWIGSTLGASDLVSYGSVTATSYSATNLPNDGRTLYVRLWSNMGGVMLYTDYTYTAANGSRAVIVSPVPGSVLPPTVTFTWAVGPGVSAMYLWIGSTPGGNDLANFGTTTETWYLATLPNDGRTLYTRLWSKIDGTMTYTDATYTAATGSRAVMISPTPGSVLPGNCVTFTWGIGPEVTEMTLSVGTAPGGSDIVQQWMAYAATSSTVCFLPTNGIPLYVRLGSKLSVSGSRPVWVYTDYTYIAAGAP